LRKKILAAGWIVGIFLFAAVIYKIGPLNIWKNVKSLTVFNFLILLGLRLLYWIVRTSSWKLIFESTGEKSRLGHFLMARLAGYAISFLTPAAYIGGEPIRILMVPNPNRRKTTASVIVDKTIEIIVLIFFLASGVILGTVKLAMPYTLKIIFISAVSAMTVLIFIVFMMQKSGLLIGAVSVLEKLKLRIPFVEKRKEKLRETDIYVSDFYKKHKKVFAAVILINALVFMIWTIEIHLTLSFMGIDGVTFIKSFLIVSLGTVAFLIPAIPGALGIYEVTYVAVFLLVGFEAHVALSLALLRRIITLFGVGAGLLGMIRRQTARGL